MTRLPDPERLGRLGAWITLGLVAVLVVRVVAIDNLPALEILAPRQPVGWLAWSGAGAGSPH